MYLFSLIQFLFGDATDEQECYDVSTASCGSMYQKW